MYVRAEACTFQKTRKKKTQISPLRYAPVEMTNLLGNLRALRSLTVAGTYALADSDQNNYFCSKFVISTGA
jgi:hypothetical protein